MTSPLPAVRPWLARRLFPLLATAGLVAVGMASTTWWGPGLLGKHGWMVPHDLWGTLVAARRLAHLDVGGLYTPPTALISLPGAAVILVPVAAVISAAGMSLPIPGPHILHPGAWLPNWPAIDHPTPWTALAPYLGHGAVAAAPARLLALLAACGCALAARRSCRAARTATGWSPEMLAQVLWWAAAGLAMRPVFESVMVAYYLWPVLAVALITALRSWRAWWRPPPPRRCSPSSRRSPGAAGGSGGRRWWRGWASLSSSPASRSAAGAYHSTP